MPRSFVYFGPGRLDTALLLRPILIHGGGIVICRRILLRTDRVAIRSHRSRVVCRSIPGGELLLAAILPVLQIARVLRVGLLRLRIHRVWRVVLHAHWRHGAHIRTRRGIGTLLHALHLLRCERTSGILLQGLLLHGPGDRAVCRRGLGDYGTIKRSRGST